MAFIRKRVTKNGVVSTGLVESYRQDGKVRHRLIANLHGAESLVVALGWLAAERDRLRRERTELEPNLPHAEKFYETVTLDTLHGAVYSAEERKEIDTLMRARKRLLKRVTAIDKQLDRIQREGTAIKRHCTATANEIRAEASKYAKYLNDREALKLGLELMRADHHEKLRTGKLSF